MDLGLKGKVALITGGSKGIGKAIAEEFAAEGTHVSICARGQQDLTSAAKELRRYGVTVVATPADVTNRSIVARCAIRPRIVVLPPLLDEWREVSAACRSSTVNPAQ